MQENRVKRIMNEGGLALGTHTGGIADPQVVEIIGLAGFDAAFIDMEHTSFDLPTVQLMVMAAERVGITSIVRADLERSGLFRGLEVPPLSPAPTEASTVNYAEWRSRLADALVLGSVAARPDGRYEVRFRLYDVVKQASLGGIAYTLSKEQVRATAHRIADFVYEKLTGEKGVFSTRIAYVVKRGNRFELQIADADGASDETALVSFEPIISPAWSPDGRKLAYVSFENKKPVVYVHSLLDGKRNVVANFRGSNSAPAWSPDGSKLAVTLSREGGSQLFLLNADGSRKATLRRQIIRVARTPAPRSSLPRLGP